MTRHLIDIYADFQNTWKLIKTERDGETKYRTIIHNFTDYFYCGEDRLNDLLTNDIIDSQIIKFEKVNKKVLFYEGVVYKIFLKGIWSKYKIISALNKNLKNIFEIDIDAPMRYTIDNIKKIEKTNYRTLYFDIETTTDSGFPNWENAIEKITCIGMYDNFSNKYLMYILKPENWEEKWKHLEKHNFGDDKIITFFDDEKEMIESFITFVKKNDYDILTAWNISFDLSYIFGRCDKLNINKYRISPYGKVEIRKQMNKQKREFLVVNINGIMVIDLLLRYKGVTFKEIPSYSLEYVSELEFGKKEKKLKVLDFSKEWRDYLDRLITYNIKDVVLLIELDKKLNLINYLEELRLISYVPNIIYAQTAKHLIDMAIFREYKDKLIFPSKQYLDRVSIGGGYVKIPKLNIYDWVVVYDFVGMYPSLIQTFNLSKDTIVDEDKADFVIHEDDLKSIKKTINREGFKTGWSLSHKGIIPTILNNFLNTRFNIKKEMKKLDKKSIEYRDMDLRQYALKAPINANYGVNAYPGFRLYEPRVAATVTYLGRKLNKYVSKRIEEDFKLEVLYGDTDSFMINMKENNKELIKKIEDKINNVYIIDFVNEVGNGKIKDITIKIELDKIYKKILLIKKRRYLGQLENDDWVFKGVDLKRSNTPEIIKECLQLYIDEVFLDNNKEESIRKCFIKLNKEKDLNKFKIPLKISKKYKANLPQVRAAKWANSNLQCNFKEGSKFYGIWNSSSNSSDIIGFQNIEEIEKFNIQIDYDKYRKILKDKLLNLNEPIFRIDYDISQKKLGDFFK